MTLPTSPFRSHRSGRRKQRMGVAGVAVSLLVAGALLGPARFPSFSDGRPAIRYLRTLDEDYRDLEIDFHAMHNFADVSSEHHSDRGVPFFWHILKSGGTTVKELYTTCYRMIEANEIGVTEGHENDEDLAIVDFRGARYVNVDTTTLAGIQKAKEMGLVKSRMSDIIFSPYIIEVATDLFVKDYDVPGKMFSVFRDPVERVTSMFYYLQKATWEPTYNPDLANMTLEEYASSPLIESNWMVRTLVRKPEAPLTLDDIEVAKETLNRKCLVGLLDHLEESLDRFDKYFGFGPVEGKADPGEATQCRMDLLGKGGANSNKAAKPIALDPTSEAVKTMKIKNWADIILYEYIQRLWKAQAEWFEDEDAWALDKETNPYLKPESVRVLNILRKHW